MTTRGCGIKIPHIEQIFFFEDERQSAAGRRDHRAGRDGALAGGPIVSHVIETLPHHAALTSSHHMQNASIALSKEAVAEIKRVAAFTEQTCAKIDTLQARVDAMAKDMKAATTAAEAAAAEMKAIAATAAAAERNAEMQMLQQAIVFVASGGAFQYLSLRHSYFPSETLMPMLRSFMEEKGVLIDEGIYRAGYTGNTEEARADFRSKLTSDIHFLTGTRPRIERRMNGAVEQYFIHRK